MELIIGLIGFGVLVMYFIVRMVMGLGFLLVGWFIVEGVMLGLPFFIIQLTFYIFKANNTKERWDIFGESVFPVLMGLPFVLTPLTLSAVIGLEQGIGVGIIIFVISGIAVCIMGAKAIDEF